MKKIATTENNINSLLRTNYVNKIQKENTNV